MAGSSVSNREFIRLDAFVVAHLQAGLSFPPSGSKEVRAPRSIFSVNSDHITPAREPYMHTLPLCFLALTQNQFGLTRLIFKNTMKGLDRILNR